MLEEEATKIATPEIKRKENNVGSQSRVEGGVDLGKHRVC
jgi:hypothetical protein